MIYYEALHTYHDHRVAQAVAFGLWLLTGIIAAGLASWSLQPLGVA